jgi:hypothetical protein
MTIKLLEAHFNPLTTVKYIDGKELTYLITETIPMTYRSSVIKHLKTNEIIDDRLQTIRLDAYTTKRAYIITDIAKFNDIKEFNSTLFNPTTPKVYKTKRITLYKHLSKLRDAVIINMFDGYPYINSIRITKKYRNLVIEKLKTNKIISKNHGVMLINGNKRNVYRLLEPSKLDTLIRVYTKKLDNLKQKN